MAEENKKEYYSRFYTNKTIPFSVDSKYKISESTAKNSKTYIEIIRNSQDQIIDFKKYLDGSIFIHHIYSYYDNGKIHYFKNFDFDGNQAKENLIEYDIYGRSISVK